MIADEFVLGVVAVVCICILFGSIIIYISVEENTVQKSATVKILQVTGATGKPACVFEVNGARDWDTCTYLVGENATAEENGLGLWHLK